MDALTKDKSNLMQAAGLLMLLASVYFVVQIVSSIKEFRFIGGGAPASNTISFEGQGEVFAKPDIALFNITIREEAKDVGEAQTKATAKEKAALDFLGKNGIEKKDIKTENYSSYPKYDYGRPCYNVGMGLPCSSEIPKIIGYEVSENISVKVRDLTKTGVIMSGLGNLGIGELNGPNLSIENEDELKAEARKVAIEEAKAKAKSLSKDLGVHLVRIVNFYENGDYPVYYNFAKAETTAMDAGSSAPAPAPELPTGQNKITSKVTITYEIR